MKKNKHFIMNNLNNSLTYLPTPSTISYMWNWGSMLGLILMIQILSGLFLSMHYNSNNEIAFSSCILLTRDIMSGNLMRLIHMNGASMFFFFIYMHIFRGILMNSFKIKETWLSGISILLILMMTAFLGYVLPWGQMSFWGTSVITNFLSVIPLKGKQIVMWLWGGFSINNPTINRFFSIHFIMPFVLLFIMLMHLIVLHTSGSSNPKNISMNMEKNQFNIKFTIKDLITIMMFIFIFIILCNNNPFMMGDPENFNPANPLNSPPHIQPEWYFLFAYAILRAIPNKLGGVIALIMSIAIMYPISAMSSMKKSKKFQSIKSMIIFMVLTIFFILTFIGAKPVEDPFIKFGQMLSIMYFIIILIN